MNYEEEFKKALMEFNKSLSTPALIGLSKQPMYKHWHRSFKEELLRRRTTLGKIIYKL